MAKLPLPFLDPNMDLDKALASVDQGQAAQTTQLQQFGQGQDSNIQR